MLGKNAPEVVKDLFKLVEEWDNEDKLKQFKEKLAGIEGESLVGLFKKLYDVGRNVFGEIYSATLLHYIVSRGAHQYLDALLEKMPKEDGILDVVDFNGDTALHLACMKGGDAVKQLLDKGADVTVANTKKETPLMLAARHGSSADVAAILAKIEELKGPTEKEAAINAQDSLGNTALQFACGKNEKGEKIKALLENGADFTLANLIGETPLIIAVRSGCSDNVAAILAEIDNLEDSAAKKAAINAKDIAKHTAWYYLNGNVDIQRLLEESKAKWVEQRSKPTKKPPVVQVVTGDGGVVKEVSEENSASQAGAGRSKAPFSSLAFWLITPPALALGTGYLLAEYANLYMFTASAAGVAMGVGLLVGIALVIIPNLPKILAEWFSPSEESNMEVVL